MKAGIIKQKWTPQEEAALRAGVQKYGAGKWRAIQKDPSFGAILSSRSNVDLKDKWRNMSLSANGLGSREKAARILAAKMRKVGANQLHGSELKGISALRTACASKDEQNIESKFVQQILEAVMSLQDINGGSKKDIADYIENHYSVPPNFKKLLTAKLKSLIQQGKVRKMRQNYLIHDSSVDRKHRQESCYQDIMKIKQLKRHESEENELCSNSITAEEAAMIAAQAVVEAEAAAAAAEEAACIADLAEAEWVAAEATADKVAALVMGTQENVIIGY